MLVSSISFVDSLPESFHAMPIARAHPVRPTTIGVEVAAAVAGSRHSIQIDVARIVSCKAVCFDAVAQPESPGIRR